MMSSSWQNARSEWEDTIDRVIPPDPSFLVGTQATGSIGHTWTEYPDPYTEVECTVVRKRPWWKDTIRNAVFLVVFFVGVNESFAGIGAPVSAALNIPFPTIGILPWWLWYIVTVMLWAYWRADGGITPFEIKRERRSVIPDTSLWSSWSSGLHCQIDNGPLVPVEDGLRCRECGRKHTYTGELTNDDG